MRNPSLKHTNHSKERTKDRGIPEIAINLLRDYGRERPAGKGALRYDFDKQSWREVQKVFGKWRLKEMEKLKTTYIVVSPRDELITAAYRK